MESGESKASQWVTDVNHNFYNENQFMYKEDIQIDSMDEEDIK